MLKTEGKLKIKVKTRFVVVQLAQLVNVYTACDRNCTNHIGLYVNILINRTYAVRVSSEEV